MTFYALALLIPALIAVIVPLMVEPPGWKRPAIFAGSLLGLILLAAGTFTHAVRICILALSLSGLAAAVALMFRRPGAGQLTVGLVFALLIGSVFLLAPAIAANPARAELYLKLTLTVSPYAAAAIAVDRDFLHEDYFYTRQRLAPADFPYVLPKWYSGPALYAAAALVLGLLAWAIRRRRHAAG